MAKFQNAKKNDWFSHKTGLAFVQGDVFKDGSRNSATFKMEIFATIGNGRFTTNGPYLTIFTGKIKIGSKWP